MIECGDCAGSGFVAMAFLAGFLSAIFLGWVRREFGW